MKIGLNWGYWILVNKLNRLLQEVIMISHALYAHSGSLRIACSELLRKLE